MLILPAFQLAPDSSEHNLKSILMCKGCVNPCSPTSTTSLASEKLTRVNHPVLPCASTLNITFEFEIMAWRTPGQPGMGTDAWSPPAFWRLKQEGGELQATWTTSSQYHPQQPLFQNKKNPRHTFYFSVSSEGILVNPGLCRHNTEQSAA